MRALSVVVNYRKKYTGKAKGRGIEVVQQLCCPCTNLGVSHVSLSLRKIGLLPFTV